MVNYKVLCNYWGTNMKKVKREEYTVNYLAVAFLIPFLGMLLLMLVNITFSAANVLRLPT